MADVQAIVLARWKSYNLSRTTKASHLRTASRSLRFYGVSVSSYKVPDAKIQLVWLICEALAQAVFVIPHVASRYFDGHFLEQQGSLGDEDRPKS